MEMDEDTIKKGLVARMQLDQMIDQLEKMDIGMPLTWLYIWDVIKHQYGTYAPGSDETYITNPEYTLDDVWDSLWSHPQFSLEYGLEQLDEEVLEWLFENKFVLETEDLEEVDE